ncbi:MAG: tetratricopeptide repeat protein [Muribaculaceae bacterium]|nr:tetratricopeptide repeat protein [Muribaculaceae bacterium]
MKNVKNVSILVSIISLFAMMIPARAYAEPDPESSGIEKAAQLYSQQKFEEAVSVYESVMSADGTTPELLYNLGNACYKAEKPAQAVLAYERALKLDPGNKQIINNLTYVRNRIDDRNKAELRGKNINVTLDDETFFGSMYALIAKETSSNYWATFAALSFVLTVIFVALYIFVRNVNARKVGFFGSLFFVSFAVIFLIFSFMAAKEFDSREEAVVTAYKIELLTEPKDGAKVSTTPLNAGTKLTVLETETNAKGIPTWYKVRLNSEFSGWIKCNDIELI